MDALSNTIPKLKDGKRPRTAGQLIYAVGDIHGSYDQLKALLAKVVEDAKVEARGRRPIIIFCGDYVDRGPQSAAVLETLIWLQRRKDLDVRALKGNHEEALMDFFNTPETSAPWLNFGGAQTLEAYGVAVPPPEDGRLGLFAARDALLDKMPASHYRFLQTLDLMLVVGDYAFVHAGIRPGVSLKEQDEGDLLWIREEFLTMEDRLDTIIVHGHSWKSHEPEVRPNRIGIDTGTYKTGVLTAVRLDDGDIRFLQAGAPAPFVGLDDKDTAYSRLSAASL